MPFELIHCDLWGPYRTTSICGSKYFLTILDDFTRAVWVYLLSSKQNAPKHLKEFVALVERQFPTQVKTLRSDNGSEFICLREFFSEKCIIHETSCVGTPQQNGKVERKHRHLLNVAHALMFQASLPVEFWSYCALAAGYLINRTPTAVLKGKTPYEILYNKPPPMQHLKVCGCLCYVRNQKTGGDKFVSRTNKSVFLGYPFGKKGWRVYNIETGIISVSRDVIFCENEFPLASTSTDSLPVSVVPVEQFQFDILDDQETSVPVTEMIPTVPLLASSDSADTTQISDDTSNHDNNVLHNTDHDNVEHESTTPADSVTSSETSVTLDAPAEPTALGRGLRHKKPPTKLADYITTLLHQPPPSSTPYPIDNYISSAQFYDKYQYYLLAITSTAEPIHYKDAIEDEHWRDAVTDEIVALEDRDTWTVETLPPGKKALSCRWVFRLKYNADGTLERHKARLVVCGNHQTEGIDYTETFAPVAKMVTVRTFLQQAVSLDWEVFQMDVHNAFLHGDLDEEVYMQFPPGFRTDDKTKVCRLRKSLYGLKQAPRCWFAKLETALVDYGFKKNVKDYSLFIYEHGTDRIHVLVYVDDLIITGNSKPVIDQFKEYLCSCFRMKDLGILRYLLGIEVARSPAGMYLCQRKYSLDIIAETGLMGAKPVSFPLEQNHKLLRDEGEPMTDPFRYRRLVGRLIYLATTRPELSYAIHVLSQFMNNPKAPHWDAALRVVRYLKNSPGQGILLKASTELTVSAWCDSYWGGCPLSRRSLTGWFIQLGDSPISWKTQKQDVVSRSSAEAEYRAMADTVSELLWLRELLPSLGIKINGPITLHSDSLSAINLAKNPVGHKRTKHVGMDCHFIRDEILRGIIATKHVSTKTQLANILTKALGRKEFEVFQSKLGVFNLHTPS